MTNQATQADTPAPLIAKCEEVYYTPVDPTTGQRGRCGKPAAARTNRVHLFHGGVTQPTCADCLRASSAKGTTHLASDPESLVAIQALGLECRPGYTKPLTGEDLLDRSFAGPGGRF